MIELNWKTVRFIVVGVLGALVYFFCSYLLLTYTHLPAYLASLLAYACSFGFAYLGQKIWAFRSVAPHRITLFRYTLLQVCCAIFAATFTQVFVSYSKVSPLLISALVTVSISGISYIVSSCWVFSDSYDQEATTRVSVNSEMNLTPQKSCLPQYRRVILKIIIWLIACSLYTYLYYYMPWSVNLYAGHDDALFVGLAKSLAAGNWLGNYSQYTLMKGPGYPLFLALTHQLGLPLYLLTAIFHSLAVSFFAWTLYRLSQSRVLSILLFVSLLLLPLVISNGHIIRDQIYPDQFLLGFSALIFSLFVAKTTVKRSGTSILAGLMFAWLWLTREEGVWILPSVTLLILYALWQFWRAKFLKQGLVSSVLVMLISFASVNIAFQYINWRVYDRFIGLDIKEKNFSQALSALQNVRVGDVISHVPVSQAAMQGIYAVSSSFSELHHYFDNDRLTWRQYGCRVYPWTCDEVAGGWFIWALREAVASSGYYQTPTKAANFYENISQEVNQACTDGRLNCSKSLTPYMPEITQRDIDQLPAYLEQLLDVLLLSNLSANNILLQSGINGDFFGQRAVLSFLHSQDRFLISGSGTKIFGQYAVVNENDEKFEILISDKQGKLFPYTLTPGSSRTDKDNFYPFSLKTTCLKACRLSIKAAGKDQFNVEIPEAGQVFKQQQVIILGRVQVFFEKVARMGKQYTAVIGIGEKVTHQVRRVLFDFYQFIFPVSLYLGLIAFAVMTVIAIKQRYFSVLFVISVAMWGAILVRLTILLLVHISSFPALKVLYFMPVYSLLLIASIISLYLLLQSYQAHYSRRKNRLNERGK